MFYAGDELYPDEITSGPIIDEIDLPDLAEFDSERQAAQDEYDEMYPQGEGR